MHVEIEIEKERRWGLGHGERNRERGRVPKAVHSALQSKGKESRVCLNHTPSIPLPELDYQIARTDIDNGTIFSQFCRFGYKTLLLIEFFCWVGFDLIFLFFLFWVFGISIKMIFFSILDICFCFVFCLSFYIIEITKNIDLGMKCYFWLSFPVG